MGKFTIIITLILGLYAPAMGQNPEDSVLKTIQIEDYTVKLIRQRAVEHAGIIPIDRPARYVDNYFIFKNDSMIAIHPSREGDCMLYFDERKKVNGFYAYNHATRLDICNKKVYTQTPPELDWLLGPVDSITIYPLDSILRPFYYQGETTYISNYANRSPEKLSKQHATNVLYYFELYRPAGYVAPSTERKQQYQFVFYTKGKEYKIYMNCDKFYYGDWVYTLNNSNNGTYDLAKVIWDKHEAEQSQVQE